MSKPQLETIAQGEYRICGELSFATVPAFLNDCRQLFAKESDVTLNLSEIQRADSAGVALLVDLQRQARQHQGHIHFQQIPAQMLAIARLSGVDQLLELS